MKKWSRTIIILLIFSLVLAACGGATPEAAPQEEAAPTEEEMEEEAPPEEEEEEEAAPEEEAVPEEETVEFAGTIRIGAAVSETGTYGTGPGEDTRNGYDLWADWVNNEYGGIKVGDERYQVEIIYYDDESDADVAANLVERLITEDEVDFLLGPYSSGLTMSTSAIAESYDVIMVEGNGASESIFERGFRNIFAVLTPAGNYTESAIKALANSGAETIFIAYADDAFSVSVGEGAVRWAEEYGLEIVGNESYPQDITDVTGIMTRARDLDPDVFLGATHLQDALLLTRSAQELGFNPRAMVLTAGPGFPEYVEELGSVAELVLSPTQWADTMSWQGVYLGTPADYAERYRNMFNEEPSYQSAESTATGLALQAAIEAAGSIETDAVRQALYDLDIITFYGPINFDETGKNSGKPMATFQIQDGVNVVVAPAEAAVADFVYPMPPWDEK